MVHLNWPATPYMKPKLLPIALASLLTCATSVLAANPRYEMPFKLAGSGLYNTYKFCMLVGDEPAK